jgi:hypothetical protein
VGGLLQRTRSGRPADPRRRDDPAGGGDPIVERLAERGTTIAEVLTELLTEVDIEARLTAGGLGAAELSAVRARLR